MTAPLVTLNDGHSIPAVGFGVFKIPPEQTEQAVRAALRAGYRHIDTAAMYNNERETGRAVADSGIPRDQIYLVTKLWNADQGYDSTLAAFDASMARLGVDYLDLYLIHWPLPAAASSSTPSRRSCTCATKAGSGRSGSAISNLST
ncbi:hypothetical protein I552_4839 [Mycobacterium xenopi 3993]|nr:hypothetical protein I552_4839 [Mycobacterium xenopi 3993]